MNRTTLILDCEYDGFQGDLISIALVNAYYSDQYFYQVITDEAKEPWVQENVIPVLGRYPVGKKRAREALEVFLSRFDHVHIVADWPEDLVHFNQLLLTGPGTRIRLPQPLTQQIITGIEYESATPHNALADARAIAHVLKARFWMQEATKPF